MPAWIQEKGTLFIVSAPSGAGKTTLCNMLLRDTPGIIFSVSYTTRSPRPGERAGRDYHFVSEDEFREMVSREEFLEWAEVHGNLYGTSRMWVEERLASGTDILLDIDVQGAEQIRSRGLEAVFIFVLPPSLEALRERLSGRKTDPPEVIRRRIEKAREEISYYDRYDYVIINDELERAYSDLRSVVISRRLAADRIDRAWVAEVFFQSGD